MTVGLESDGQKENEKHKVRVRAHTSCAVNSITQRLNFVKIERKNEKHVSVQIRNHLKRPGIYPGL